MSRSKTKTPFPKAVKPMLATLIQEPFDDEDWIFEIKFDGYRMIAGIKENEVELTSRNLNKYTDKFPSIVKELKKIKHNAVLDGEIVALDSRGRSNFQMLQNFQSTENAAIVYYLFDILWCDGYSLERLPLTERKKILNSMIPKSNKVKYSDDIAAQGKALFDKAEKEGLEGIIAKKADSVYTEGVRSRNWLKIKTELRQEAIICGYTEPAGSRKFFGSLILGINEGDELIYIGHTGTGFTEQSLKEIHKLLTKYHTDQSPFHVKPKTNSPVTWLKPRIVCEVKFSNWTKDGLMRHPVFVGIREDKSPKEVVKET